MNKNEKSREKELKRLIYLRSQLIKECKKDIKQYHDELKELGGKQYVKNKG